ncbi:uncharacterized protein LOC124284274 [Haliotis rubra]|uniref:uncharacterized protein LOC124284274 n=1 Tax=Haliotis rubra TaxID=36100 RepID=UPI001EE533C2|nr:uncharacterized protein LOC124284274 [Haliotis rubra]
MNLLLLQSSLFISIAFAMNTASRHLFSRVITLDNLEADEVKVTTSQSGSLQDCVGLCARDALCVAATQYQDQCFTYRSSVSSSGKTIATARTFIKYSALPSPDPCPVSQGYTSVLSPRLCYKTGAVTMNWTDGQVLCQSEGGRLIILNTEDKYDYVVSDTKLWSWIGLEVWNETSYAWTDGSTYVKEEAKHPDKFYRGYNGCGFLTPGDIRTFGCHKLKNPLCEIVV